MSLKLASLALVAFFVPSISFALTSQEQAEKQLSMSGVIQRDFGTPEEMEWTDFHVVDCEVTFKHFRPFEDGEIRLNWSDRIPVAGFGFQREGQNAYIEVKDLAADDDTLEPLLYVDYHLLDKFALQRIFPTDRKSKHEFDVGPILKGKQYLVGDRKRGGFLANQPSEASFFLDWIAALRQYTLDYCNLAS